MHVSPDGWVHTVPATHNSTLYVEPRSLINGLTIQCWLHHEIGLKLAPKACISAWLLDSVDIGLKSSSLSWTLLPIVLDAETYILPDSITLISDQPWCIVPLWSQNTDDWVDAWVVVSDILFGTLGWTDNAGELLQKTWHAKIWWWDRIALCNWYLYYAIDYGANIELIQVLEGSGCCVYAWNVGCLIYFEFLSLRKIMEHGTVSLW